MNNDLISRTEAVSLLREKAQHYTVSMFLTSSECNTAKVVATECAVEIFNLPAVDAEPVRHAHWEECLIQGYPYVNCSACKKEAVFKDVYSSYAKSRFRPSCGAKMDGGAKK